MPDAVADAVADAVPDLARRRALLLELVGTDVDEAAQAFHADLLKHIDVLFARVLDDVRGLWPDVDTAPFRAKWQYGFNGYVTSGLGCLVFSRRRSLTVRVASRLTHLVGVGDDTLAVIARRAIPVVLRLEQRACRRLALVGAWIMVLDEALDDALRAHPPRERLRLLVGALRGTVDDDAPVELKAAHAIGAAVRATLRDADDAAHLERVVDAVEGWAEGEVSNLLGEPDPAGLCHRLIGVTASVDLLTWAMSDFADEREHEFLCLIAQLGQMVDDWLDVEKDLGDGRQTPVITGRWRFASIADEHKKAQALLKGLADDAGEREGAYRRLLERGLRQQMQVMIGILIDHP